MARIISIKNSPKSLIYLDRLPELNIEKLRQNIKEKR